MISEEEAAVLQRRELRLERLVQRDRRRDDHGNEDRNTTHHVAQHRA